MKVAPTSQNHEMPRIERKMSRRDAACFRIAPVSPMKFQLTLRLGAVAGAAGIAKLAAQPKAAATTTAVEMMAMAPSTRTRRPPADRKSVGSGKRGSVSVYLGGRRCTKKKKRKNK